MVYESYWRPQCDIRCLEDILMKIRYVCQSVFAHSFEKNTCWKKMYKGKAGGSRHTGKNTQVDMSLQDATPKASQGHGLLPNMAFTCSNV